MMTIEVGTRIQDNDPRLNYRRVGYITEVNGVSQRARVNWGNTKTWVRIDRIDNGR